MKTETFHCDGCDQEVTGEVWRAFIVGYGDVEYCDDCLTLAKLGWGECAPEDVVVKS